MSSLLEQCRVIGTHRADVANPTFRARAPARAGTPRRANAEKVPGGLLGEAMAKVLDGMVDETNGAPTLISPVSES